MADFTPINTQEEFDAAIKPRLERERATISKKYEDYDQLKNERDNFAAKITDYERSAKENTDKITNLENQLKEANTKAAGLELDNLRTQVAIEKGLPMELRGRLNGKTKEELEKDAESLSGFFKKKNNQNIPGFEQHDSSGENDKKAAIKSLVKKLRKGE